MDISHPRLHSTFDTCKVAVIILAIIAHLADVSAYLITLDAGVENECFHERVPVGTKLGFSYEVIEGGFYDVDVEIKDPSNVILHQDERSTDGKFTLEANIEGAYQFCFSNKKSSHTPKVLIFEIDKTDPNKSKQNVGPDGKPEDDETKKLSNMVDNLSMDFITSG